MFKRTLSAIAIGAVLAAGFMSSANAVVLNTGGYKITFDNFDQGNRGYASTDGVLCTTVAGCDALAASNPGTVHDTAGILSVATISTAAGVKIYTAGIASTFTNSSGASVTFGPYLTGVFSGLDDYYVAVGTTGTDQTTSIRSVGGAFSIFSNTLDWDPTQGPLAGNLDLLQYNGISGGSLFLTGNFVAGVLAGDTTTTYSTVYNNAGFAGSGSAFLDFTGGSALPIFRPAGTSGGMANGIGGNNDAFLEVTYNDTDGAAADSGWLVASTGSIKGSIQDVPEPGSLALISLAMLGLGATTARRRNKKG